MDTVHNLDNLSDYEIAEKAAVSMMAHYQEMGLLCTQDFQDMWHEAYLEIAELRRKKRAEGKPAEYFFKAGKNAAKHWFIFWRFGAYRQKIRNARTGEYMAIAILELKEGVNDKPVHWSGYDKKSEFWESITDEKLRELLYAAKKRHSGVHEKALEEDLVMLRALGEGLTNAQVAEKMHKTESFIKSKRQMTKKILLRYAETKGIKVC